MLTYHYYCEIPQYLRYNQEVKWLAIAKYKGNSGFYLLHMKKLPDIYETDDWFEDLDKLYLHVEKYFSIKRNQWISSSEIDILRQ